MAVRLALLSMLLGACSNDTADTTDAAVTERDTSVADGARGDDADTPDARVARDLNSPGSDALLGQVMRDDARGYADAVAAGVTFHPTTDGESFYAYWAPEGFDPDLGGFVVALHGHSGLVTMSFAAWRPFLVERGYGFIALQWWFGGEQTIRDYYSPAEMYAEIRQALRAHDVPGGRILFEGFSRGSANSYAVEAMDHSSSTPQFLLTIANAGSAVLDYPPTAEIDDGVYGSRPFDGTHWVFFCGGEDRDPMANCAAMIRTRAWLEGHGATIDLFIEDPTTGHGGFHMNAANATMALELYDNLREAP